LQSDFKNTIINNTTIKRKRKEKEKKKRKRKKGKEKMETVDGEDKHKDIIKGKQFDFNTIIQHLKDDIIPTLPDDKLKLETIVDLLKDNNTLYLPVKNTYTPSIVCNSNKPS
jgi:hypothetical protein